MKLVGDKKATIEQVKAIAQRCLEDAYSGDHLLPDMTTESCKELSELLAASAKCIALEILVDMQDVPESATHGRIAFKASCNIANLLARQFFYKVSGTEKITSKRFKLFRNLFWYAFRKISNTWQLPIAQTVTNEYSVVRGEI